MSRKVLVVDDNEENRELLRSILQKEYEVLEADTNSEALSVLPRYFKLISAVLLDVDSPALDGVQILASIKKNVLFMPIPVIVTTGRMEDLAQERAMSLGANGFVTKPFSPAMVSNTVKNMVRLREVAALNNALQKDKLTGLYNREAFFETAGRMIAHHENGVYVLSSVNIQNFKIINDQYGAQKGDDVLRHVGAGIDRFARSVDGIAGRFSSDKYAVLFPARYIGTPDLLECHEQVAKCGVLGHNICFRVGRYLVDSLSLSPRAMYDRAVLAQESIRNKYGAYIADYDESMMAQLMFEQELVTDIEGALDNHEFEPWFQPQYNHATGALIGAEALARWRRRGELVPPGVFVPIFERNGFIYEMDKYIWEQVCILLRRWLDEGRSPLPISVNVSRCDVVADDFLEVITGLVIQYRIPTELLRLEITESAFADAGMTIVSIVRQLIEFGFTVEIDDFGSGYSSLNTLKDVPAQILKLDMRFLSNTADLSRSGNILESIVRMAKWLGMSVIAEGVEERNQADYLKSIGCHYVQGYYYDRPMPLADYDALARKSASEMRLDAMETVETYNHSAFWDAQSMDSLIFNSYVGGACIFEYHDGKTELVRQNDQFRHTFDDLHMNGVPVAQIDPDHTLDGDNLALLRRAILTAIETKKEASCEIRIRGFDEDGDETLYLRSTVRMIAEAGSRYLIYCVVSNETELRLAEMNERSAVEQFHTIIDNINGGVTAALNRDGVPELIFANERFFGLFGYTKDEYERGEFAPFEKILPEDVEKNMALTAQARSSLQPSQWDYRIRHRDGSTRWLHGNISFMSLPEIDEPVELAVTSDITELVEVKRRQGELVAQMRVVLESMEGGFSAVRFNEDNQVETVLTSDRYYKMFGYTQEEGKQLQHDILKMVLPEDRQKTLAVIASGLHQSGDETVIQYRARKKDGGIALVRCRVCLKSMDGLGGSVLISHITDITDLHPDEEDSGERMPSAGE